MKKFIFAFVVATSFIACNTTPSIESVNTIDTLEVDTLNVDSINVDTLMIGDTDFGC